MKHPPTERAANSRPSSQVPEISQRLQTLPAVHEVLDQLGRLPQFPQAVLIAEIRRVLEEARGRIMAGHEPEPDIAAQAQRSLQDLETPSIQRVINATGVVLHTNLGRAPLGPAKLIAGYSNLEYDLTSGRRGKRDSHLSGWLHRLLSASGIAVNNGAAAVYLVLHELAGTRESDAGFLQEAPGEGPGEVVVSRGELIEIGDGFRIPEIMQHAGGILREVGTTNRTRLEDYSSAINPRTRLIMRVHPSNFHISGFTARPELSELAALGKERGIPVYEDLGSGCVIDLKPQGIQEPLVVESLRAGVDLVSFSGDKLLGGQQAGIIAGRGELVDRVSRNPMFRALRLDKLVLQMLESTLRRLVLERYDEIPALLMMRMSADHIRARAQAIAAEVRGASVIAGESVIGGGSTPDQSLPTWLIALRRETEGKGASTEEIEQQLRANHPPVIARIREGQVLIDLRTVFPEEEAELLVALQSVTTRD